MLTQHNYQPSDKNIGEGSQLFDCCRKDPPDDPKCTDCCYDDWRDELKEVTCRYTSKVEEVLQMEKQLSVIMDRRNRYRKWIDELIDAEDKARLICHQLDILASQSEKIWYNSCKATEAIEILFCMIRDFYFQVDQIKIRYDFLQNCINSNNDPSLVRDQGILKCLGEYYKKLEEVIKTRAALITAIVEAIRLAQLIRNNISTQSCPRDDDSYNPCDPNRKPCDCNEAKPRYGFKTIICEWYCAFECWDDCKDANVDCKDEDETKPPVKQQGYGQQEQKPSNDPCEQEKCDLTPTIGFPICRDGYKGKIKKMLDKDEKCVPELSKKLNDAKKEKELLTACKVSLENAIKEVNPKDRCK
ncbi:hypothetical protein [Flavitalea sp.]|nr:hypothetical protein [Flavitalea sp.]